MVMMLSVQHQPVPTLFGSLGNIFAYLGACGFFGMMLWSMIRGEK